MARPVPAHDLPVIDTLIYGGYDFGPYTRVTAFRSEMVPTAAGWQTAFNRFTLSLTTWLHSRFARTADVNVDAVREVLSTQGLGLDLSGKSLGTIRVNLPGSPTDVQKGPIPKVIDQEVVGGGLTTRLDWTLTWSLPTCADAAFSGVLDYWYDVTYHIDRGYTTRTAAGKLVIAQNRMPRVEVVPAASADAFRPLVGPPPLPGFLRSYGPFRLSPDRSELDFSVIDEEMGLNIPPPGIVKPPEVSYAIEAVPATNKQGVTFVAVRMRASLEATYEFAKTASPAAAINAFCRLVKNKVDYCKAAAKRAPGMQANDNPTPILSRFTARENDVYGRRTATFACSWSYISNISDMLGQSGLWQPVPDSNWQQWQASVPDQTTGVRGTAGLVFQPNFDFQVSLCHPAVPQPSTDSLGGNRPPPRNDELRGTPIPPPTRTNSILDYRVWWHEEREPGVVPARLLPADQVAATSDLVGQFDPSRDLGKIGLTGGATGGGGGLPVPPRPVGNGIENTLVTTWVQRRVRTVRIIYLCGYAARAGFDIPRPNMAVIRFGNRQFDLIPWPQPGVVEFQSAPQASLPLWPQGGENPTVPVYTASWRIRYIIDGDPPDEPLPQIPQGSIFVGLNQRPL